MASAKKQREPSFWTSLKAYFTENGSSSDSFQQRLLRGFAKGGVSTALVLLALRRSRFGKTEVRRAISAGAFTATFRVIREYLENQGNVRDAAEKIAGIAPVLGTSESIASLLSHFKYGVAGWLSSLVALSIDGFSLAESSVFVVYCVTRAIWYCGNDNPLQLPPRLHFLYPVIVMSLTAGRILSCYFLDQFALDPSYYSFLCWQGGHDTTLFALFRQAPRSAHQVHMFHPHTDSCTEHKVKFFFAGIPRAVRLYLPVHLFILAISRTRSLQKFLFGLGRSSVFLSLYCTLAWTSVCILGNAFPHSSLKMLPLFFTLLLPGLSILVEEKRRQSLIAAYCATYAVDSAYKGILSHYNLRHTKRIGTLCLILSAGFLFHNTSEWVPHALATSLLGMEPVKEEKHDAQWKEHAQR